MKSGSSERRCGSWCPRFGPDRRVPLSGLAYGASEPAQNRVVSAGEELELKE